MQLDGWHLLFEECLLDLTYLYNLNVTKTSKSRLLLDYMFVWSDYYIRVMQISEGPSSTLAVKKHNAFSVAFFVAFSKLEGCCKPSFENTLSNSKWTIEWSFENLEQDTVGNLNSRIGNCMFQIPLIENSAARKTCKKLNTKQSRQVHSGYVNIISRTAECESLVVCFFSMVMGHFDTGWVS